MAEISIDGDNIVDATIDGESVEEITIDGVLAWAAAIGLDGLTVTRQDGSYTASSGEHVVSDGGSISLPTPVQDGVVMVTNVTSTYTQVIGSVDGYTDPYVFSDDAVVFVSDGSNWWAVDREQIGEIPDSVDYYFPLNEGSGATYTDTEQSATVSGVDSWASDADFNGGEAVDFNGSPDRADDSNVTFGDLSSFTVLFSLELTAAGSSELMIWSATASSSFENYIVLDSNGEYDCRLTNNLGDDPVTSKFALPTNTKTLVGLHWDGSTLYAVKNGSLTSGTSLSGTVNIDGFDEKWWAYYDFKDSYEQMEIGSVAYGTGMTQQDITDFYNSRPWS